MMEAVATEQHTPSSPLIVNRPGFKIGVKWDQRQSLVQEFNKLIDCTRSESTDALEQAVAARDTTLTEELRRNTDNSNHRTQ